MRWPRWTKKKKGKDDDARVMVWCREDNAKTGHKRHVCPRYEHAAVLRYLKIFARLLSEDGAKFFFKGNLERVHAHLGRKLPFKYLFSLEACAHCRSTHPNASTDASPPLSLSRQLLTSELQGLAVSVSSLERQLVDRESVCDGLRRQLEAKAGGDSSARENELARQV